MRVLLRSETGLFFKSVEEWTASGSNAAEFKSTLVAMEFAREHGFVRAEVVLWFNDPAYDISLPVRSVQGNGEEKSLL